MFIVARFAIANPFCFVLSLFSILFCSPTLPYVHLYSLIVSCFLQENKKQKTLPEHLKSGSWSSATFWPFNWDGDWHLVCCALRGVLRKNLDNHDKWQSHANGFSDKRRARNRPKPLKTLCGIVVKLLLFKVLWKETKDSYKQQHK